MDLTIEDVPTTNPLIKLPPPINIRGVNDSNVFCVNINDVIKGENFIAKLQIMLLGYQPTHQTPTEPS